MKEGVANGFVEAFLTRGRLQGQFRDGFVEGGLAFGIGIPRAGPAFQFLPVAEGGGGLVGELGHGQFAAIEPDEGAAAAEVEVEVEAGNGQRPLLHRAMAAGAADGRRIVAGEAGLGLGFEFGEGFLRNALDGFVAGEFEEMSLAVRAAQDRNAFIGFRFERDVADGAIARDHGRMGFPHCGK